MNKMNAHILKLISLYTTDEISEKQFNDLQEWLNESVANKQMFSDYLQFYKKSRRIGFAQSLDKEKAWSNIVSQLENSLLTAPVSNKAKVLFIRKTWFKYAAAASILLIVALTIFLNKGVDSPQFIEPIIVNNNIKIGTDKATLTLEDGSVVTLEKGKTHQTKNASSNGEQIVYNTSDNQTTEIAYNYLTIPRGGQYFIKLSDGTQVWLNSESQLKYPVTFNDAETRQVELIYGEAYFDVSPGSEHDGAVFKVYQNKQEVQVLGTEFNIKAYKDETNIYTTLVEGKVAISIDGKKQILVPNQQSNLNLNNYSITIKTVDIYNEISWKEGVFSFEDESLKEIMKVFDVSKK